MGAGCGPGDVTGAGQRRGEFHATQGVCARVKRGLLRSHSPQGKVRFGLPQHALRSMFPQLWPGANADSAKF